MNNKDIEYIKNYRERFIRWQLLLQKQLSMTNNLLTTLSVGLLGYTAKSVGFIPLPSCILNFTLMTSYFMLIISLVSGVLLTINRLVDYRITLKVINARINRVKSNYNDMVVSKGDIENLRQGAKETGNRTWILLLIQIITFSIGTMADIVIIATK